MLRFCRLPRDFPSCLPHIHSTWEEPFSAALYASMAVEISKARSFFAKMEYLDLLLRHP